MLPLFSNSWSRTSFLQFFILIQTYEFYVNDNGVGGWGDHLTSFDCVDWFDLRVLVIIQSSPSPDLKEAWLLIKFLEPC